MDQKEMKTKKQLFKSIPLTDLKEMFNYNSVTGDLYFRGAKLNVKLNEDNNYSIWFYYKKRQHKVLAIEIAYTLHTGRYSLFKVRTKDLDNSNLKANNLFEVTHEQETTILMALLNLRKYLKVINSELDQNACVVRIYNKVIMNKKFDSVEAAGSFIRKSKLMFMKLLEKNQIDINSKYLY